MLLWLCASSAASQGTIDSRSPSDPLPGTSPLTEQGDLASLMVDGIDRFLLRQIAEARPIRERVGVRSENLQSRIDRLKWSLGIEHKRADGTPFHWLNRTLPGPMELIQPLAGPSELGRGNDWKAHWATWNVFQDVRGNGLVLIPEHVRFLVVLYPDAGQSPADLCGIGTSTSRTAIDWVEQGGLVVIPTVISRQREKRAGRANLTDQEYLYRSGFELGRHIVGYQVQEGMSAIQSLRRRYADCPVLAAGWGEGGWLALHLAAVDDQVNGVVVSGHFGPREEVWKEPIHRNLQNLLKEYTDAQLATIIAQRHQQLVIDAVPGPDVIVPGEGGAPGELYGPTNEATTLEYRSAVRMLGSDQASIERIHLVHPESHTRSGMTLAAIKNLLKVCGLEWWQRKQPENPVHWESDHIPSNEQLRQATLEKWDRFQQRLLLQVHQERDEYWKGLDTTSLSAYEKSIEPYRDRFREEVIGWWDSPKSSLNPRSRRVYDKPTWDGYEVVLDVFEDVIAVGVLLIPKGLDPSKRHPCVVFQHGLEGRPKDVIEGNHEAYHDVAAKLAEKGYVVFAPQNPYLFMDRFRTLQRKSNPMGCTLFSTIIPQHQQIVTWLKTLPQVDGERIGFYGLSYGGKSAMRIPALVPEYSLSICSADFNDWVWKNASTESPYSYVWTMEYEIFEFGLGPRFNYAEMARLICPRPFMVERGHFDGVAPDDRVAMEYAKVRHLYAAKLGIGTRTEIEWFVGPHTVHGQGTFDFLDRYLKR